MECRATIPNNMNLPRLLSFALLALLPCAPVALASGPDAIAAAPVLADPLENLPAAAAVPGLAEEALREPETPAADSPAPEAAAADPAVWSARQALLSEEAQVGADDIALAAPLEALALAQLAAGENAAAAATLQREIGLLEKWYGLYDMRLAGPLALLGEAQSAAGKHEEAIESLQRAQHVVHRADGVYSLNQLEYVDRMSGNYVAMRNYAEADRHNRFAYFVSEQKFGSQSMELVPAILKLADWYRRAGNVRDARKLYERAVKVIENSKGKEDPGLIAPLLGLGTTTHKISQYRKQREAALKRMVAIVDAQDDLDTVDRAAAWGHLGDFYILINRGSLAADAYGKGWDALHADGSLPSDQPGLFSEPMVLNFPKRIYLMDQTPATLQQGFDMSLVEYEIDVEFDLTIGENGRVLKVRVVNLEASPSVSRQVRRYIREARFRPRIIDGKPARTEGFRLQENLTIVRPGG